METEYDLGSLDWVQPGIVVSASNDMRLLKPSNLRQDLRTYSIQKMAHVALAGRA